MASTPAAGRGVQRHGAVDERPGAVGHLRGGQVWRHCEDTRRDPFPECVADELGELQAGGVGATSRDADA